MATLYVSSVHRFTLFEKATARAWTGVLCLLSCISSPHKNIWKSGCSTLGLTYASKADSKHILCTSCRPHRICNEVLVSCDEKPYLLPGHQDWSSACQINSHSDMLWNWVSLTLPVCRKAQTRRILTWPLPPDLCLTFLLKARGSVGVHDVPIPSMASIMLFWKVLGKHLESWRILLYPHYILLSSSR